jgi:hypothetical protein
MQSKAPDTRESSNSLSWLYPSIAVIIAVALGWSIFWFVKSRLAVGALTAWMSNEAQLGREWSCLDRKTGGFPFSVEISCANPIFQGEVFGKKLTGSVRGFHATAPLLQAGNVVAQLDPPLTAKTSDGALDVTMQWGQLVLELEIESSALHRMSLSSSQVRLQGKMEGTDAGTTAFDELTSYFVISPSRHDRAYDLMVSFNQGSLPALNKFLDTELPVAMAVEGTVSQVDLSGAVTLQNLLDRWRAANGHLDITTAWLTSGSMMLEAKGGLDLDDEHRPKGKLDASFSGLEKVFRHFGIDPGVLRAGQALSGMLGGGTGRLELPMILSEGYLSIGPVRTPIEIPPLY